MIKITDLKILSSRSSKPRLDIEKLSFKKSKINVILGANGAGKSSLLEVLSRNLEDYQGQVLIEDKSIESLSLADYAKKVSYIPQRIDWNMDLTVREIILFSLYPYLKSGTILEADEFRFDRICKELEIEAFLDYPLGSLSGGEQKRVAVASALFQNTKFLIMDEPFAALDPIFKKIVANVLKKWQSEYDCTLVLTIHDLFLANTFGDYFWGIKEGELVEETSRVNQTFFNNVYGTRFLPFEYQSQTVFLPDFELDIHERS